MYVWFPVYYNSDLLLKNLDRKSFLDSFVHLWMEGLPSGDIPKRV